MRWTTELLIAALVACSGTASAAAVGAQAPLRDRHRDVGEGRGVFLSGSSSTQFRFQPLRDSADELHTLSPLWQSLRFSVRDDGPHAHVAFHTALRGSTDFGAGGFRADVQFAWVDVQPTSRVVRARLGRQWVSGSGSSGFTRFDGASLRAAIYHLGLEAFAGVPLRTTDILRTGVFAPAEGEHLETGWGRDWTHGFGVFLAGAADTQLRLGLQDRLRDGQLARRHLSLDAAQALWGRVNLWANLSADLLQRRMREVRLGVAVRPLRGVSGRLEFTHWEPSFDAEDVFSVFATDPYDALDGSLRLQPDRAVSFHAGGGWQRYPVAVDTAGEELDEPGRDGGTLVLGATVRPLAHTRFDVLQIELRQRSLLGLGGGKHSTTVALRVTPWGERLQVGLRGVVQRYELDLQPGLRGSYGSIVLDLGGWPLPWLRVGAQAERLFSPWLAGATQVTATLDLLLGAHLQPAARGADVSLGSWQPAVLAAAGALARLPQGGSFTGLDGGVGVAEGRR